MFFSPLIEGWGVAVLAADLDLPVKNVRRWIDNDSIPAEWFAPVARAARRRGVKGVTEKSLAAIAEQRRMAREGRAA